MVIQVIKTLGLMVAAVPAVGIVFGLGFGNRAEKYVYPTVIVLWGIIIYWMWFS